MIKVYGTNTCPDCMDAKANLDFYHIPYTYIDVCTSVKELKEFIQLRDHASIFQEAKENGFLGIPAIIKEDGSITLDWEASSKKTNMKSFMYPVEKHVESTEKAAEAFFYYEIRKKLVLIE